MTNQDVFEYVSSGKRMTKPDVGIPCPDLYYAMMLQCWHSEPSRRPTFVDLYNFFGTFSYLYSYILCDCIS